MISDEQLERAVNAYEDEYLRILPTKARDYAEHRDAVASALLAALATLVPANEAEVRDVA